VAKMINVFYDFMFMFYAHVQQQLGWYS